MAIEDDLRALTEEVKLLRKRLGQSLTDNDAIRATQQETMKKLDAIQAGISALRAKPKVPEGGA